ncbi:hypothetical protein [Chlamydia sp. 17-3921]|uniref:hypothetical protein n=1 Tax=Chlamydia sp. 17-3921 TaxID=2675798 RepID=UPI0019187FDB|nr:hypothetical protein [Chlamydia sp. 17-3921]
MLGFFYKHQKKFISIVVISVCVSGLGIGWGRYSGGVSNREARSRNIVFTTASGKKYFEHEFSAFKKFFANEAYPFTGNFREWNFINEGLITERFLTTKLGEQLFFKVYAQGFPAFSQEKNYQPYRRFDAPFISSEEVWKSSAPSLFEAFKAFQAIENPVSSEGFAARIKLFLEERKFPHYVLKQMLEYRRQMFVLPQDQTLFQGKNLRLFSYNNLQDWLGEPYVSAAVEALIRFIDEKKKDIAYPSLQEAREDFYDKAKQAFTKLNKHVGLSINFNQFVSSYFQFLGVSEAQFFKMYRDILLCKRAFLQMRGGVSFDYRPLNEFFTMGRDASHLELFRLPKEYQFKTQQDLVAFETYLHLVGSPVKNPLDVPHFLLPIKMIKAKEPRLIGRRFSIQYRTLLLQDLEAKVPMMEVLQWQQNPDHFHEILQEFPKAETCKSHKDFQQLKSSIRNKIYAFTRKAILRAYPERILEGLKECPKESREIFLSTGKDSVLDGILDSEELAQLLCENEIIEIYSQDKERYYSFHVDMCCATEEVLPYREVLKKELAMKLVSSHDLTAHVERVKLALRNRYPKENEATLWQRRLWNLLEEHRTGTYQAGSLPWNLEKISKVFYRGDPNLPLPFEDLSQLEIGKLSDIVFDTEGPYYYQCLSHIVCDHPAGVDKLFLLKSQLDEELFGSYMQRFIE